MSDVDDPQLTVVVPTHNRAGWLRGVVDSALAQTRGDLRVIVADNASDDATPEVMAAVDDPRVTYLRRERDIGSSANMADGIARATTPFVAWLLDDDWWTPTFVERTLALLEADERLGLVHTGFGEADGEGVVRRDYIDWTCGPRVTRRESGPVFIRENVRWSTRFAVSAAVWRRAALPDPVFDPHDADYGCDLGMALRLALRWDTHFVAEPLAVVRRHAGALTWASSEHAADGNLVHDYGSVLDNAQVKRRFLRTRARGLERQRRLRAMLWVRTCEELMHQAWKASRGGGPRGRARELAAAVRAYPPLAGFPPALVVLGDSGPLTGPLARRFRLDRAQIGASLPES